MAEIFELELVNISVTYELRILKPCITFKHSIEKQIKIDLRARRLTESQGELKKIKVFRSIR